MGSAEELLAGAAVRTAAAVAEGPAAEVRADPARRGRRKDDTDETPDERAASALCAAVIPVRGQGDPCALL